MKSLYSYLATMLVMLLFLDFNWALPVQPLENPSIVPKPTRPQKLKTKALNHLTKFAPKSRKGKTSLPEPTEHTLSEVVSAIDFTPPTFVDHSEGSHSRSYRWPNLDRGSLKSSRHHSGRSDYDYDISENGSPSPSEITELFLPPRNRLDEIQRSPFQTTDLFSLPRDQPLKSVIKPLEELIPLFRTKKDSSPIDSIEKLRKGNREEMYEKLKNSANINGGFKFIEDEKMYEKLKKEFHSKSKQDNQDKIRRLLSQDTAPNHIERVKEKLQRITKSKEESSKNTKMMPTMKVYSPPASASISHLSTSPSTTLESMKKTSTTPRYHPIPKGLKYEKQIDPEFAPRQSPLSKIQDKIENLTKSGRKKQLNKLQEEATLYGKFKNSKDQEKMVKLNRELQHPGAFKEAYYNNLDILPKNVAHFVEFGDPNYDPQEYHRYSKAL